MGDTYEKRKLSGYTASRIRSKYTYDYRIELKAVYSMLMVRTYF